MFTKLSAHTASSFYKYTPLILSQPMSKLADRPIYLKLDTLQSSGSFKDRGMANLCCTLYYEKGVRNLVSSSGGNAGLAVTTVAKQMDGMNVQVIVPKTTKTLVIEKLKALGADVTVHGENWNEADLLAREIVSEINSNNKDEEGTIGASYVSPYDDPMLWTGHSTVVDEIVEQLPSHETFGAIVASVGGGGLICGILEGLAKNNQSESNKATPLVIAAETEGASSFAQAWEAGKPITLKSIDSIASSLGALSVTEKAITRGKQNKGGLVTGVCTDKEAVEACLSFANHHRILVEPACGAALATIYSDRLRNELFLSSEDKDSAIVIEVCGGSGVNIDLLTMWRDEFSS